jgi:hypothetical protein
MHEPTRNDGYDGNAADYSSFWFACSRGVIVWRFVLESLTSRTN